MIKVLFVHYSLVCGGVETALLNLCTLLDKRKFEVTILEYIGCGNVLKPQFIDAGIRIINPYDKFVPGKHFFHKAYNVLAQRFIEYRIMKKNHIYLDEEFDIIVYYQLASLRVKCRSNPKIISYIHCDVATNQPFCEGVIGQTAFINSSDKVVCVSEHAKESLAKIAGITKNTISIFNPINSQKITTLSCVEVTEQFPRPYILAIGRLSSEKRFDGLVQIHKNLLDRGLNYDLVIIGEGGERSKIEFAIQEAGTLEHVHLLGFKENPYPYIKNCICTVCSSNSEGLHIVSMESLLLGKPVVSAYPTVGELFGEEECGIITDIDLKSLEEGIYQLLSDHTLYTKCTEGAKKRGRDFESIQMISSVEKLLEEVLQPPSMNLTKQTNEPLL